MAGTAGFVFANQQAFAAGETGFTLSMASERLATGTPATPSGYEAVMPRSDSRASVAVSGSGRVIIGATGSYCDGWPKLNLSVDGTSVGQIEITSNTSYGSYYSAQTFSSGTHNVVVTFANDYYVAGRCDRNLVLGSVRLETAGTTSGSTSTTAPVASVTGTVPTDATTGVPDGTALTVHQGDLNVTTAGTVIDKMDIRGSVYIKANNVTIKRSLIRGGPASSSNLALVASWWGNTGTRIEDSTLRADYPSYYLDGVAGANISVNRADISRVVDGVKINGGNISITNSWIHNNSHFEPDPLQSDGKTHDDSIQVISGSNITISNNLLEGSYNSAMMISQGSKPTSNMKINGNWLYGGACTVNISQGSYGQPIQGLSITNNKFGTGRYSTSCPVRYPATSPVSLSGNTWIATGKAIVPQIF